MSCGTRRFGGFGSDFCSGNTEESWRDRAEFVKIAAAKGSKSVPGVICGKLLCMIVFHAYPARQGKNLGC